MNKATMNRPIEILLVEDNPGDTRFVQEVFHESKLANNLTVARDGVEAMEFLRRQGPHADAPRPDLVLLDLNLPRKDGRQVLSEIKNDPSLRHLQVVVLTVSQEEADILEAYDLNADGYIPKPVEIQKLLKVVSSIPDFWVTIVTRNSS